MPVDPSLKMMLETEGYENFRLLPNGEVIATKRMLTTYAIVVGLTREGYRCRYCYENPFECAIAALQWNGVHPPPGPWIKHKGRDTQGNHVDDINPAL